MMVLVVILVMVAIPTQQTGESNEFRVGLMEVPGHSLRKTSNFG